MFCAVVCWSSRPRVKHTNRLNRLSCKVSNTVGVDLAYLIVVFRQSFPPQRAGQSQEDDQHKTVSTMIRCRISFLPISILFMFYNLFHFTLEYLF